MTYSLIGSVFRRATISNRESISSWPTRHSLLLLRARTVGSEWVQYEVAYALSDQISVLALTTPGVDVTEQFEVIDDAFRPAHPSIVCWPTLR